MILSLQKILKTQSQVNAERQQAQAQQALVQQAGQLASTPIMDPSKNPAMSMAMEEGMAADLEQPPTDE